MVMPKPGKGTRKKEVDYYEKNTRIETRKH